MTETAAQPSTSRFRFHLSMRWKLLMAFGIGFTVVFAILAIWILRFATDTATDRLTSNLRNISEGGAQVTDVAAFEELKAFNGATTPGATYPADAGTLAGTTATSDSVYPTDQRYWRHDNELANIRRTNPEASPYSFYEDEDGTVRFLGSWGALGYPEMGVDEPAGGTFKQDVTELVDAKTLGYFRKGLEETTFQPQYRDAISRWISVYTPITNSAGATVGAIGVDYDLAYVDQVRSKAARQLYPVFAVAYVLLLVLVALLSTWLTRRLARLSNATKRVADGDYDVDLSQAVHTSFPDEMTDLTTSFMTMADKVEAREKRLVSQMKVLKVEIDEKKRQQAVMEITETDFFADLSAKADAMRAKVRAAAERDGVTEGAVQGD